MKPADIQAFENAEKPGEIFRTGQKVKENILKSGEKRPEELIRKMDAAASTRSNVMPNPETQPERAGEFLKFIRESQGPEASRGKLDKFLKEQEAAKNRKAVMR